LFPIFVLIKHYDKTIKHYDKTVKHYDTRFMRSW